MNLPRVLKPENPVFFDEIIGEMQDILSENLSWIDHFFGNAQKLETRKGTKDKKIGSYPGIYIGGGKYINVFPSEEYGNYCFFNTDGSYTVDQTKNSQSLTSTRINIIFWFNLSTMFDSSSRRLENVKSEILDVLTFKMFLKSGRVSFSKIEDHADLIYNEYDISEADLQFLMHPFTALKFSGDLKIKRLIRC